jgi:hypothetical protein
MLRINAVGQNMKRILPIALTLLMLIMGVFGLLMWSMFGDQSEFRQGLASHKEIPDTATDITIYTNRNITGDLIADFMISEADFVTWTKNNKWNLQAIKEPVIIRDARAVAAGDLNGSHSILNGLYMSDRRANGGGIDLAYNRANSRGYVARSSR